MGKRFPDAVDDLLGWRMVAGWPRGKMRFQMGSVSRRSLLKPLVVSWLINILLGALIGTQYFGESLAGLSVRGQVFAWMALVSSIATVLLLPWLLLVIIGVLWPSRRLVGASYVLVATLAQVLLFVDTRIWGLFRYHLNGMVWNVLTTPGGLDTFNLGGLAWAVIVSGILVVLLLQLAIWCLVVWPKEGPWGTSSSGPLRQVLTFGVPTLLVVVALEKGAYAIADLSNDREISALTRLFPVYQPLTAKRLLSRLLNMKPVERDTVQVAGSGLMLRYPHSRPSIDPKGPRPNILIVVIDSLRADALSPETMPHTWRWSAAGARRFDDHASGGNATRFGIFSLMYGIHGTYWPSVYAERVPPVLVTELQALEYDMRVFSACGMTYPEFRSTAWVSMQSQVVDNLPATEKWRRDEQVGQRFGQWLDDRTASGEVAPFFAFTLLDGPHQEYDWPRERTVFRPYLDKINYIKMASSPSQDEIQAVRNSWRNAVLHADSVFGSMVQNLEQRGLLDSTIVVVTGDHGEEFFEHGMFGHTGNYTRTQVLVPFVMGGPGVAPGVETRPTSHIDLPLTILEMLGAAPAERKEWTQGVHLLFPLASRNRVIAGWHEVAIWVDGGILYIPLEGHKGLIEPMTWDWKSHPDGSGFLAKHSGAIQGLALECRAYLR